MDKIFSTIPLLKGWNFSEKEIQSTRKNNHLLLLDAETSNICNLNCPYCYRDEYTKKHIVLDNELTIKQRKKLIDEAKQLGCKAIKIVGAGEPLTDPKFFEQIEHIFHSGIIPVIYTNGILLTPEKAKRLYDLNCSIMLKFNSLKDEVQDELVGRQGYTKQRNKALQILIDAGFNKAKPTRLGFDSIIVKQNKGEIIDMLRFCRKNNIFPSFKTFIPTGGAIKLKKWEITKIELLDLYKKARLIDRKEFVIDYTLSLPYIGGFPCTQLYYGLFVDILGNVFPCPGSRVLLGNIKEKSLLEIWNSKKAKQIRSVEYNSCPPREKHWKKETKKYREKFFEGADFGEKEFRALIPKYYPPKYRKYIQEETKLLKNSLRSTNHILEAGIGVGRLIPILSPLVNEFIGVDNADLMITKSKEVAKDFLNTKIVKGNLENLSGIFSKNYFDYSLCVWNTLGNVKNEVMVLKELSKITSKSIFITVYKKGTLKDRINWYKTVGVKIKKIDKQNEIFYSQSGLKSKSYSLSDIEEIAKNSRLKIKKSKILNGVILWIELVKL